MAWIYSSGAVAAMMGAMSYRHLWSDFVLDLYGGVTPPATADAAATGTKLVRITVGSNALTTTYSVAQIYTAVLANRTAANTVKFNVTVDGVGPTTYTYTFSASDSSDLIAAVNVARWLKLNVPQISAIAYAGLSLVIQGLPGLSVTIADGSGTTAVTVTSIQASSRSGIYTLQFGPPVSGVINKTSDVWSGVGLATGVASYGRLVLPTDDGALTSTEIRAQGAVATSGAEITMSNTTITSGATTTVDAANITKPTGA
jgi:hypothetical protein